MTRKFAISTAAAALLALSSLTNPVLAAGGDTPAAESAKAYFINLKDGDTVTSPFLVQMGLTGMGVAPAGLQGTKNTGHHHLFIDTTTEGKLNKPIPADANHKHFGKGQTETTLELAPGKHSLQLVVGDWKHTPHTKPVVSEKITITVK